VKENGMTVSVSDRVADTKKHSPQVDFWIRLIKEKPMGTIGAVITLVLVLTGVFANFLAPHGYNEVVGSPLLGPSAHFWLGTDNLGRDMLSRIIYGARISLIAGLAATLIGTLGSVVIGISCGYLGGAFDLIVQRFVDAWMCLPFLPLMMIVMSLLGAGMYQVILCLGIAGWFNGSRLIRSATIAIKENMYLQGGVAIGCSTRELLSRHVLPNIMSTIIISFSMGVPGVILTEASLSFLGFGIPPPTPSWGGMLNGAARTYMFMSPWLVIWPGLALSVVVYGINMFGDAVRDLFDPRLRGGVGRYGTPPKKRPAIKSAPNAPKEST
jgi:peptide/nickel transport system permease protein